MSAFEALKFEHDIENIIETLYLNKSIESFKKILNSIMNNLSYHLKGTIEEKNKQMKYQIFNYICRYLDGKYELEEEIILNIKSNIKKNNKPLNILIV